MSISNTLDTQTIEIKLNDNVRNLLNDQNKIKEEMKFNVKEIPYSDFSNHVNKINPDNKEQTCITLLLFDELFK